MTKYYLNSEADELEDSFAKKEKSEQYVHCCQDVGE